MPKGVGYPNRKKGKGKKKSMSPVKDWSDEDVRRGYKKP